MDGPVSTLIKQEQNYGQKLATVVLHLMTMRIPVVYLTEFFVSFTNCVVYRSMTPINWNDELKNAIEVVWGKKHGKR